MRESLHTRGVMCISVRTSDRHFWGEWTPKVHFSRRTFNNPPVKSAEWPAICIIHRSRGSKSVHTTKSLLRFPMTFWGFCGKEPTTTHRVF